jgi:putative Mg2+ transporter-C (MgtC) family protein
MIGLERSHRGRQAGFREHTLVCVATCQLMLIGVYDWHGGAIMAQPYDVSASRMIQGIMSGIGFLGAGGILKEGFSVRGLTTAASIWMTASIGILIGVGFYFPALITTLLTLSILTLLRWLEGRVLHRHEVQLYLRQNRQGALHEPAIRSIIAAHGFTTLSVSAYGSGEGRFVDYKAVLTTEDKRNGHRLLETLTDDRRFVEFSLVPLE